MNPSNLLAWLNFFVADVRDGLGPFLGVFLLQNGFGEAQVGLISTISHIIALALGVPCGILVDKTTRKKECIAFFVALIVLFCSLNYFFPSFVFTLLAQCLVALSGVFLAPAFAALTLGIIGVKHYPLQCARNEAYKHAGTAFGAALSFVLALHFGIASVFVITALLGGCSLVVLGLIRSECIDDFTARGEIRESAKSAEQKGAGQSGARQRVVGKVVSIWALFADKRVVFLSAIMFCFHLSNAAMLPLLSQRAQKLGIDSSGAYAAATILIAQSTMILVAFACGRALRRNQADNVWGNITGENVAVENVASENLTVKSLVGGNQSHAQSHIEGKNSSQNLAQSTLSNPLQNPPQSAQQNQAPNATQNLPQNPLPTQPQRHNNSEFKLYFWLFFACFFALIIRGGIAANFAGIDGMIFTQILDGVGAGVSGVIVPVIVAFMLRGSGHINAGLALVLTCGGLGAALSNGIGGYFAQFYGYLYAYLFLGAVAMLGLLLWLMCAKIVMQKYNA
ncbi:MFS transporter [Helicobacter sp. MIT 01-3238]|uniref:MFS transporter n=1 Tax=Helicobacter sp. MIT 01-3238 TaxID=398627 RepID=UPI000E1ECCEB|nr:MFS transporter [Helicobacter sp. MIT 01-3238]RDU52497.1 hypothetical protein CQA40_07130 [Helicobacter sp. MIT 01-3238]